MTSLFLRSPIARASAFFLVTLLALLPGRAQSTAETAEGIQRDLDTAKAEFVANLQAAIANPENLQSGQTKIGCEQILSKLEQLVFRIDETIDLLAKREAELGGNTVLGESEKLELKQVLQSQKKPLEASKQTASSLKSELKALVDQKLGAVLETYSSFRDIAGPEKAREKVEERLNEILAPYLPPKPKPTPTPSPYSNSLAPAVGMVQATISDADGFANIREKATKNSSVVGVIKEGEIFETSPSKESWWAVTTDARTQGFVHNSRIRLLGNNKNHEHNRGNSTNSPTSNIQISTVTAPKPVAAPVATPVRSAQKKSSRPVWRPKDKLPKEIQGHGVAGRFAIQGSTIDSLVILVPAEDADNPFARQFWIMNRTYAGGPNVLVPIGQKEIIQIPAGNPLTITGRGIVPGVYNVMMP